MAASSPSSKAKKKNKKIPSTARTWKRSKGEELSLPSDNVAIVKRPGPEAFLAKGLLPDNLTPIVEEAIRSGKGMPQDKTDELAKDPEAILGMLDAMDRILCTVVIEPQVTYHKRPVVGEDGEPLKDAKGKEQMEDIPEEERDDELLYSDDVDLEDKMFIFNFAVGGTRDLERFREEHGAGLGDLHSGEEQ